MPIQKGGAEIPMREPSRLARSTAVPPPGGGQDPDRNGQDEADQMVVTTSSSEAGRRSRTSLRAGWPWW